MSDGESGNPMSSAERRTRTLGDSSSIEKESQLSGRSERQNLFTLCANILATLSTD